MKKHRIIAMIVIMVLSITSLTGCGISVSGDKVPSESEVMKYVDELCPNEDVEYTVSKFIYQTVFLVNSSAPVFSGIFP